jgi:hypothetical protein
VPDPLLSGDEIRVLLLEVADLVPETESPCTIIVVGGSLLALLGYRDTTDDVDSIRRLETSVKEATAIVADRHGLAPKWLNDAAAWFMPQTFEESECEILINHPRLRVLGAPLQQIFAMKLYAARAIDVEDLVIIWSECGFDSPQAAADLYHQAYPHVAEDPFLVNYIEGLARRSEE